MKKVTKLLIFTLLAIIILPGMVEADDNGYISRLEGKDRIETSIAVSREAYKSGEVDTLLLSGYSGEADALTSTFIAGQTNAPLLITHPSKLNESLVKEIQRLNPKEIVLLGGENVISGNVKKGLEEKGYKVKRLSGNSRIETAIDAVSEYLPKSRSGISEVFIIEYNSLVDALAAGPVSAKDGIPILISKRDGVPDKLVKFLKDNNIQKATIIGGETTISDKGKKELERYVNDVTRLSGSNRVDTSIKIGNTYFKKRESNIVANGVRYNDALVGGYFGAKKNAPIILANDKNINQNAVACIGENKVKAYVLGGDVVVNSKVYDHIGLTLNPKHKLTTKPKGKPAMSNKEVAKLVFKGDYGNGPERIINLTAAGYDPVEVDKEVDKLRNPSPKPEPKPDPKPEPKPEPDKPKLTIEEIAKRVINGDYGNGAERIDKLRKAGYDPVKVQREVDRQLGKHNKPENPNPPARPGKPRVFFDYGHGGKDPGASYKGRYEKDDALFIGTKTAKELRKSGVEVHESRTTDVFLELWDRTNMANAGNYDYFVSFHRNAFMPEKASGVETFTHKNSSEKSKSLSREIQKNLVGVGFNNRGAKHKNLYVLRNTKMPSVLIEVGFIDNTKDNKKFDKDSGKIAKAISKAIVSELDKNK